MPLPIFFMDNAAAVDGTITLPEEVSKHVIQVLRMKVGENLELTDGAGNLFTAEITNDHKKTAQARILHTEHVQPPSSAITIAISLIKNTSRFEWFLEKATEIGIQEIIPLICERTERQHFRFDRMKAIVISAMLQSRQVWLPKLQEPVLFNDYVKQQHASDKCIAHCIPGMKQSLGSRLSKDANLVIMIGPEGDFTPSEIELALQHNYVPVTLGETRLRTETAGVVAAALARNVHA